MPRSLIFALAAVGLAVVSRGASPSAKNRTSAQVSEKSVEQEIEEERSRLHQSVQRAVPVSRDTSRVNMWKTARPAAAKVKEAAAVAAGDWADDDGAGDRTAEKKPVAYDANAAEVERERGLLHRGGESAPDAADRSAATRAEAAAPVSKGERAAPRAAGGPADDTRAAKSAAENAATAKQSKVRKTANEARRMDTGSSTKLAAKMRRKGHS